MIKESDWRVMKQQAFDAYERDGRLGVYELEQIVKVGCADGDFDEKEKAVLVTIISNLTRADMNDAMWLKVDGDAPTSHTGTPWSVGMLPESQLLLVVENDQKVYPFYARKKIKRFDPEEQIRMREASVDFSNGEWRHLALAVSGSQLTYFLDGEVHGRRDFEFEPPFDNAQQFLFFHDWGAGRATRFWGAVDEFCWVPRVLDQGEVQALVAGREIDLGEGFLLPMEGEIAEGRDGRIPGVFGRSGGGDDGTRVRAEAEGEWLRMEAEVALEEELKHPFIDLDVVGEVRVEVDEVQVDLSGFSSSKRQQSVQVFHNIRIPLDPMNKGEHKFTCHLKGSFLTYCSKARRVSFRKFDQK